MNTLNFKEGQTYICTKSSEEYWTEGKEYEVTSTIYGIPALPDNNGNKWTVTALKLYKNQFKLKEKTPSKEFIDKEGQAMMKIVVTKYNGGEGIVLDEYNYVSKYSITDDYLILDDDTLEIKTYIQKDQVLEFEVHYE